jgi:anti-sigma factor RsiW
VTARTHDELQELLGAYALDAVEPDEAEAVERHLEGCPRCRAEVEAHREVASLLGNAGGDAPDGLWDRIAGQLEEPPPPMRLDLPTADAKVVPLAPRRREVSRTVAGIIGAAAVLAIAVLGIQLVRQERQLDDLSARLGDATLTAAANQALDDPDAVKVQLESSDGDLTASAVVLPDGTGYLVAHELHALEGDETYQLWGDTGQDALVSLGLLGGDPGVIAFQAGPGLRALAVTAEEAGGVAQSQQSPVVAGAVA